MAVCSFIPPFHEGNFVVCRDVCLTNYGVPRGKMLRNTT